MKKLIALLLVWAWVLMPSVMAASSWTMENSYTDKATAKFEFGFTNVLLGWTDLIREPINQDNLAYGIGKGLSDAVLNTVGGVLHLGTFFIPVDIPLPDNGVQLD